MINHNVSFTGIVHGKMIELEDDPGLADGQKVEVSLKACSASEAALMRAFGMWSEDSEDLDTYMDQVRKDRKQDRKSSEL